MNSPPIRRQDAPPVGIERVQPRKAEIEDRRELLAARCILVTMSQRQALGRESLASSFDKAAVHAHQAAMTTRTDTVQTAAGLDDPRTALRAAIVLLAAFTMLRSAVLFIDPNSLYADETQYWLWSQSLDWGYFSKPPMIAWVIAATTTVFGDADWAVRLAAPVLHLISAMYDGRYMHGSTGHEEAMYIRDTCAVHV